MYYHMMKKLTKLIDGMITEAHLHGERDVMDVL